MLALYTHLLCVFGAYLACQRSLKTYMGISALITYAETGPPISKEEPISDKPKTPWWKSTSVQSLVLSMLLSTSFIFILGVPDITLTSVLNTIWGGSITHLTGNNIYQSLDCILPSQRIEKLDKRNKSYCAVAIPDPNVSDPFYKTETCRRFLTFLITGGIMVSAFSGVLYLTPIVALTQVIPMAGKTFYVKLTVRSAVRVVSGLLTFFALLGIVIVNFVTVNKDKAPKETSIFTQRMMNVLTMLYAGMAMMLPAALLAITYRFEYVNSPSFAHKPTAENGQIATPIQVPSFSSPITSVGVITYIASVVVYHAVSPLLFNMDYITSASGILFVAFPLTVVGTTLMARRTGNLKGWLDYYDVWYPSIPSDEGDTSKSGVEQAPI
ncbi:uncharacterized protein IL334_001785 [Kwoniella shivajii]|uniref:Uncharacterized protein n=1 Tax=Kwoniella shivajii TaxID=564305 RepID=A0ABZ1CUI4_9TREE|nr:hypothetical protein IL334_001785 [Kwoniella shivajii]